MAGWRPATTEAASFSSRTARVLHTLRQLEAVLREPGHVENVPVICNSCTEVAAYLIVWLHDLDVQELGDIASMTHEQMREVENVNTVGVRVHVLDAWDAWAEDRSAGAVRHIGRALVVTLALCAYLGVDVETELSKLDLGKRKTHGKRHPDTW